MNALPILILIKSHVVNGLESHFFFPTLVLLGTTDSLAGKAQASSDERELLLRVHSGIESLLEGSHSELPVPIPEVDVVLLDIGKLVEHSTQESSHTFVEFLNFELQNVLVRVLDQPFADDFFTFSHLLYHFLVSLFILFAVLFIIFLDFVGWMEIGFIHIFQKVNQCVCRLLLIALTQSRYGVSHVLVAVSLS